MIDKNIFYPSKYLHVPYKIMSYFFKKNEGFFFFFVKIWKNIDGGLDFYVIIHAKL